MTKITINVTRADIEGGIPNDEHSCPIARAMRRVGVGSPFVAGNLGGIYGDQYFSVFTPEVAKNFMGDFDVGFPVDPLSFEIEFQERHYRS